MSNETCESRLNAIKRRCRCRRRRRRRRCRCRRRRRRRRCRCRRCRCRRCRCRRCRCRRRRRRRRRPRFISRYRDGVGKLFVISVFLSKVESRESSNETNYGFFTVWAGLMKFFAVLII